MHDGLRHAYVYSYFSYDLLTLAASQTFPCLELALRLRIGHQFAERSDRKGKLRPPVTLPELVEVAKSQGLIAGDVTWINHLRRMFAHGSDTVLNAPLFLEPFRAVTEIIAQPFRPSE
jgi:hypothetical protein